MKHCFRSKKIVGGNCETIKLGAFIRSRTTSIMCGPLPNIIHFQNQLNRKANNMKRIRWGILGCGTIAQKFASDLKFVDGAELVAAGSRRKDSADAFAEQFGIPHSYGSYEELAVDKNIDVIYVATPHPLHFENTKLCLEHDKAVLCEKPFAMNFREAQHLIEKKKK